MGNLLSNVIVQLSINKKFEIYYTGGKDCGEIYWEQTTDYRHLVSYLCGRAESFAVRGPNG